MLQDLCRDHGLWLHLEGHALSGLTLVPASGSCVHGDSMTLTFGSWIGIPAVPFVTLYRYLVLQRYSTIQLNRNLLKTMSASILPKYFPPNNFSIRMIIFLSTTGRDLTPRPRSWPASAW